MFEIIQIDGVDLICYDDGAIWRWSINKWKKFVSKHEGYYRIGINKKSYRVHRIIAHAFLGFDLQSELVIDHIDRDIHNNAISNLRPVTQHQNQFNTDAKGYRKVKWINKDGTENIRWRTQLMINEKQISKYFKTEDEARTHYLELKEIHHVNTVPL